MNIFQDISRVNELNELNECLVFFVLVCMQDLPSSLSLIEVTA